MDRHERHRLWMRNESRIKFRHDIAAVLDANLSRAASLAAQVLRDAEEAAYLDSRVDAGEWSAVACWKALHARLDAVSKQFGYRDWVQLLRAIEDRTTEKYTYFTFGEGFSCYFAEEAPPTGRGDRDYLGQAV